MYTTGPSGPDMSYLASFLPGASLKPYNISSASKFSGLLAKEKPP